MEQLLKSLSAITACSALLSGCVSFNEYPSHWANLSQDIPCSNLVGSYQNTGMNNDQHPVDLSKFIYRDTSPKVDTLKIDVVGSNLIINFLDGQTTKETISSPINTNNCEADFIKIEIQEPRGWITESIFMGHTWKSPKISLDQGNDLIVKMHSTTVGFLLFIPVFGTDTSWYKFSKIE